MKIGVQGHMGTFGVLTASGGGSKRVHLGPKNEQNGRECKKNDPNLQKRSDFWLVGEARHEIRGKRPYGNL